MRIGRDPARPQAAVIGGSLGGLFAALLLRRAGWQVRVFERIGEELSGGAPASSPTTISSRCLDTPASTWFPPTWAYRCPGDACSIGLEGSPVSCGSVKS